MRASPDARDAPEQGRAPQDGGSSDGTPAYRRADARAPTSDDLTALLREALADRYVVETEIERGGMAVVYRARDLRHGRTVALKAVRPEYASPGADARFAREIRIAAALQHPHVVAVYDSGAVGDLRYYVMPFVEGESLRQRLARGPAPSIPQAVRILRDVASALAYAHARDVIHRDIKPANVLLTGEDALVADFGIARALTPDVDPARALTAPSLAVGTPGYMAPEQAWAMPVDHRADLYALGVVAHEMLVGARPPPLRRSAASPAIARDALAREIVARRPEVPAALAGLVATLLAELPDDRPPDAEAVMAELDAVRAGDAWRGSGDTRARPSALTDGERRTAVPRRAVAAVGAALVLVLGAWIVWSARAPRARAHLVVDPNRILIFPPEITGRDWPAGTGEDVATMIGSALDGTPPLRWLEASDYARTPHGDSAGTVRRAISLAQRAAYYIDGRIMRQGDSARVVLRLRSVAGDSTVARRHAAAPLATADVSQLALRAVGELLVPLLAPGRRVDVAALQNHPPAAIAAFLEGERAYRASQFERALERYQAALAEDGTLALAALNGAQAATWIERADDAQRLARRARTGAGALPAHQAAFARGMVHFLDGAADSALRAFDEVLAHDSSRTEPWMALGEVYRHLLPDRANLDSLAEDAFVRARAADTAFAPALFHLAELAIRRGAYARADTILAAWRRSRPDSTASASLARILACARDGPAAVDWSDAAARTPLMVIDAGRILAGSAPPTACAQAALWAVATAPQASAQERWGAQLALLGVLVSAGREADVATLARTSAATDAELAGQLLLLAGAARPGASPEADSVARALGTRYAAMSTPRLWLLGSWEGSRGHGSAVESIAATLARRADTSRTHIDRLVASAVGARATLARGDTTAAIRRLAALRPSAARTELTWYAWEALAAERLLLARLLLARHDHAGAERAASQVDGLQSVASLVFLAPALQVRAQAAEAAGDAAGARRARQRLAWLARSSVPLPAARGSSSNPRP